MMSLSKSYFELTSYITKDEEFKDFWNILFDEYKLSIEMTLLISQYDILMEEDDFPQLPPELMDEITESAMRSRENDLLRHQNG